MNKELEAKMFTKDLEFDGAPAILRVRLFVHGGKVVGVRSVRILNEEGRAIPEFVNGQEWFEVSP